MVGKALRMYMKKFQRRRVTNIANKINSVAETIPNGPLTSIGLFMAANTPPSVIFSLLRSYLCVVRKNVRYIHMFCINEWLIDKYYLTR